MALIAPCGMNCGLCRGYQRTRNPCPGCRADDRGKPKTRTACRIKIYAASRGARRNSCAGCPKLPCFWLTRLDRRYRTKYGMSMIDNLRSIEAAGLRAFVEREKTRWACPGCGQMLCVHQAACPGCGRPWR